MSKRRVTLPAHRAGLAGHAPVKGRMAADPASRRNVPVGPGE